MKMITNTRDKIVCIIIFVIQLLAIMTICFSVGVIFNAQYEMHNDEESDKILNMVFEKDKPKVGILKKEFPYCISGFELEIHRVAFEGEIDLDETLYINKEEVIEEVDEHGVVSHIITGNVVEEKVTVAKICSYYMVDEDNKYTFDTDSKRYFERNLTGRWFTNDEMNDNSKVCIADNFFSRYYADNKLKMNGDEYTVCGKTDLHGLDVMIPMASIADDARIDYVSIQFERMLTPTEYDILTDKFERIFEGYDITFQDYVKLDVDVIATRKTLILISVFLTALSVIALWQVYIYKIEQDKKKLAIYYISGKSRTGLYFKYMLLSSELILLSGAAADILFRVFIISNYSDKYTWFEDIYSQYSPEKISSIVAISTLLFIGVLSAFLFRKSPYSMWKKK